MQDIGSILGADNYSALQLGISQFTADQFNFNIDSTTDTSIAFQII